MEHVRGFGRGHSGHLILGNIIAKENINTHTDVKQGSMYSQTPNKHTVISSKSLKIEKKKYDNMICIFVKSIWMVWP